MLYICMYIFLLKLHSASFQDTIFLVDAISSFGAVPLDVEASKIDVFISSANKCLQGVPGFAFVLARNELLNRCKGMINKFVAISQKKKISFVISDFY